MNRNLSGPKGRKGIRGKRNHIQRQEGIKYVCRTRKSSMWLKHRTGGVVMSGGNETSEEVSRASL